MYKVRMSFSKDGPAAYISHLDLMRCFQRAFRRAGLPVAYSEGFNPHIRLSILAPLSAGHRCAGDVCDFELIEPAAEGEEMVARMNRALPPGLRAIRAVSTPADRPAGAPGEPLRKPGEIAFSAYEMGYPEGDAGAMAALFAAPVEVEKRSKRGRRQADLRDYIAAITFEPEAGCIRCRAVVRAGDDALNPRYITAALVSAGLVPEGFAPDYLRTALLDRSMDKFF